MPAELRRVCVVGAGAIGSLLAAHLSRVCEAWVLTRRPQQAEQLNHEGLTVSGKHEFVGRVQATADASELPDFDLGIIAVKANDLDHVGLRLAGLAPRATMMTIQNGLGAEAVIARHGDWPLISSVAFEVCVARLLTSEATTANPRPASPARAASMVAFSASRLVWSAILLISLTTSPINSVSALTELPHVARFVDEQQSSSLGHVVRTLVDEGKAVAAAAGIELYEDPWEMNKLAVKRGETSHSDYAHLPSMLEDVLAHRPTEVDFIAGALHREADRLGVPVPVTAAAHRLIKGKEASWRTEVRT